MIDIICMMIGIVFGVFYILSGNYFNGLVLLCISGSLFFDIKGQENIYLYNIFFFLAGIFAILTKDIILVVLGILTLAFVFLLSLIMVLKTILKQTKKTV